MIKVRTDDQSPGPPLGPPLTAQWSDPQTRKPFKSESNIQYGKQREETDARGRTRAALFPAMIEPPQLRMIVESKFQRFQRVQD